jgi:shikimate kinase
MSEPLDNNIILTGFMGTGKSTVGRLLAARLELEWVDTDALIEERFGPIPDIFATEGEEQFRGIEEEIASELSHRDGLVISTGGRMMTDDNNAEILGRTGLIFCLVASTEEILDRMTPEGMARRPLLAGSSPAERLRELMAERAPAYGRFPQVSTGGRSLAEIVDDIVGRLEG